VLEPVVEKPADIDAWLRDWRSRLDAAGARDFLPEGLPDDPPPLGPEDDVDLD
jgi:antitoxin VapB